jgi:hypothetical protein
MRKLIFLLSMIVVLLVLFLDTTYVAANTLSTSYIKKLFIVQGSTNVLSYPGYSLIETNVNYNKEGQYFAKYKNDQTNFLYERELEVISKDNLFTNGLQNLTLEEQYSFETYKIFKKIKTNILDMFILYDLENYYLHLPYPDRTITRKIGKIEDFSIVDIHYDKDENLIYVFGNRINESLDLFINTYSLKGVNIEQKFYGGSNVDTMNSVAFNDTNIYIVGKTTSSDNDFEHSSYQEDSYILSVNKKTLKIENYLNLAEVGNDQITNVVISDAIYLIKLMYMSGIPVVKIVKLDENLTEIKTKYLGTVSTVSSIKLHSFNDNVYYFCSIYDYNINASKLCLYRIDNNLSIKLIDEYYDSNVFGSDFSVEDNEIKILYKSINKEENYPVYLRIIGSKTTIFTLDNKMYDYCYFNKQGRLELIYENELTSYNYNYVIIESFGNENSKHEVEPIIKCNNKVVQYSKSLSDTSYNDKLFGIYSLQYYYSFDFFDLVYKKDIVVDSVINIDNNNIYKCRFKLIFNGNARIFKNDIEIGFIVNEFILSEPGLYKVELYGKDEILKYKIEVVDIKNNKEKINNIAYEIYEENILSDNDKKELTKTQNTINNKVPQNDHKELWYILLPILTTALSVCSFVIISRRIV